MSRPLRAGLLLALALSAATAATAADNANSFNPAVSLILSGLIPNCLSYDPTFSFEVAVIMREGMRRMYQEQEDIFYYLTVMNENYEHPEMPVGAEADILKGMYLLRRGQSSDSNPAAPRVQLLGSGTIFREVIAAAELLKNDWGVDADLWACPSFTELARNGNAVQRANLLNPAAFCKNLFISSNIFVSFLCKFRKDKINGFCITLNIDQLSNRPNTVGNNCFFLETTPTASRVPSCLGG